MTQKERRIYLIKKLIEEDNKYNKIVIPNDEESQKELLRGLFNVREAKKASAEFLKVQDKYLQLELKEKGITKLKDLDEIVENIYLWRGDITTLKVDAIVNAANNRLLGFFVPNHKCIDNAIHTYSGIQLRESCNEIMEKQNHLEETGKAKITSAYNLPSKYVIHTVGPIVDDRLTENHKKLLESCYLSCLEIASENKVKSIAFCCISTGEFHFPNTIAAEIAIDTVKRYLKEKDRKLKVVFNVFKSEDEEIYQELLS